MLVEIVSRTCTHYHLQLLAHILYKKLDSFHYDPCKSNFSSEKKIRNNCRKRLENSSFLRDEINIRDPIPDLMYLLF